MFAMRLSTAFSSAYICGMHLLEAVVLQGLDLRGSLWMEGGGEKESVKGTRVNPLS